MPTRPAGRRMWLPQIMHIVPVPQITDPDRPLPPTWLERQIDHITLPWLVDSRDVVFTRNAATILLTIVPASIGLYLLPTWLTLIGGCFYLPFLMHRWAGPFVLMVHAVTHRPLFRKKYNWV